MKHITGWLLALLLLFALCIPCAAKAACPVKQRGYHTFSDIPTTKSLYFSAVKTCYEFGWMDGISENTFGVKEPLSKAEMVTLLARLYSVLHGGDGTIPPLPENLSDCIRFYDADGNLFCNTSSAYTFDLTSYNAGPQGLFAIFYDANLTEETLTIEIGFPGDGNACRAPGVRVDYDGNTKYRFTFPKNIDIDKIDPQEFQEYCLYLRSTLEVNQREGLDDPNDYAAILYLLYREPANLPYCFRTMDLESAREDTVWRAEFAIPLSRICDGLPNVRDIDSLPDMPDNWRFHEDETKAILSLYRKGILTGYDETGTFGASDWLTRGQAAIIIDRVLTAIPS